MLRKIVYIFIVAIVLLLGLYFILSLLGCKKLSEHDRSAVKEFRFEETTINDIHEAYQTGILTCRQLVVYYLERIKAYDQPTGLNAIVVVNPKAIQRAEELDKEFQTTGKLRPLHGIPFIVKDNYDTHDLPTAAGSLALKDSYPPDDAYQVKAIREAGAVVLAKSNMAEWAFSPYQTVSSVAGTTRNPYDLSRVPAGSSGGTAAAVAANLGTVGLGTDTGNSIRGPSSHTCLVGVRSTLGLTSRDGIVPLYLRNDVGGPMTRTVEDAARILDVIVGYDPADPLTQACINKTPESYMKSLDIKGLEGARIGVLRALSDSPEDDPEIRSLFEAALSDLENLGAILVDPLIIPNFDELRKNQWCDVFQHDINVYLMSLGVKAPYKNIADIVASGLYSDYIQERLQKALKFDVSPEKQKPPCLDVFVDPRRIAFREGVLTAMKEHNVEALVYPSWDNPPRKVGDLESPHGNNSPQIAPHTGQPALTVPMGFTQDSLPAGLQLLGKPFGEAELLRFAYAYEQATQHRRPPEMFSEEK